MIFALLTRSIIINEDLNMTKKLLALAIAGIFSSSVSATNVSYDNFTLGWSQASIDAGVADIDADGFTAGVSFSFDDNWYGKVDTTRTSGDDFGADYDFDLSTINIGYRTEVSSNTDFIAELGYAKAEFDVSGLASEDDSGYNVVLGFRGMPADNIELGANVQHIDLDGSSTFFNLEGRYFFTDSFSLGLKASFESDTNIYSLTARFEF